MGAVHAARWPAGGRALGAVGASGALAISEAGKLNVNTATPEMLAKIPGLTEAIAGAIVGRRAAGPIGSVESLADVEGLSVDAIYAGASTGGGRDPMEDGPPALLNMLTALSADPSIQLGEGDNGASYRGDRRINVNASWSDALGKAIARRYDQGFADAVKNLFDDGTGFDSEGGIVGYCLGAGVEREQLPEILDVFCAVARSVHSRAR